MKKLFLPMLALAALAGSAAAGPYDTWTNVREVLINTDSTGGGANVSGTVTNFPVLVRLTNASNTTGANVLSGALANGADVRFTDGTGNTALAYEIESWSATSAAIWVKVPSVAARATTKIRLYWGKTGSTTASSGPSVFDSANGFQAVWHMGDTGNVADATPNGNTAINSRTTATTGAIGGARNFGIPNDSNIASSNATAQYLRPDSNAASLKFGGNITMEAWARWLRIRPTSSNVFWRNIMQRQGGTANAGQEVVLRINNTSPYYYQTGKYTGSGDVVTPNQPMGANAYGDSAQWVHLVGVYDSVDAATKAWKLYRNGVLISSNVGGAGPFPQGTTGGWHIGRYAVDSQRRYWFGDLDELRISSINRDSNYVKLSYETQKPTTTAVTLGGTPATGAYSAWSGNRSIILNTSATGANVNGTVTNFPVLIRLGSAEASILSAAKAGGADIRFAKNNDSALAFQIESWTSTSAAIWVKVDTIKGNNATQSIKMYWGNPAATSLSNGAAVFDTANGYRAVFHLNESDSANVTDATVNAVVGTNTSTTSTTGAIGPARNFGGTNAGNNNGTAGRQAISLGTPAALSFAGRTTYSVWARWLNIAPTATGSTPAYYRTALWRGGGTNTAAESFLRISSAADATDLTYSTGRYTGSANVLAQSSSTVNDYADSAQWVHWAGVYDSTGPTERLWRLYRNGVQVGVSADNAGAGPNVGTVSPTWQIGRSGSGTSLQNRWWSGDLDEVSIASVSRDSTWIKLSYESQKRSQSFTNIGVVVTVPGAPTAVTASNGTANQIVLTWTAPAENGGTAITGYKAVSVADTSKSCTTTGALTCSISGLAAGTYTFTVKAINSVGSSLASAPSNAISPTVGIRPGSFAIYVTGAEKPYAFQLSAEAMASTQEMTMHIVDLYGRTVWSKTVNPSKDNVREIAWNGKSLNGRQASAGVYLVRVSVLNGGKSTTLMQKNVTLKP